VPGLSRRLGASFDGLTIARDSGFECKSLNDDLRAALPNEDDPQQNDAANLPKCYRVQMEQQLMVSGPERVLFGAGEFHPDGIDEVGALVLYSERPQPARRNPRRLGSVSDGPRHAQAQRHQGMPNGGSNACAARARHPRKGEITTSNMKEYGEALAKRLAEVRAIQLVTDQDFSNAKESAKLLRENIQQAKHAKDGDAGPDRDGGRSRPDDRHVVRGHAPDRAEARTGRRARRQGEEGRDDRRGARRVRAAHEG
jgi:hypothetical protein